MVPPLHVDRSACPEEGWARRHLLLLPTRRASRRVGGEAGVESESVERGFRFDVVRFVGLRFVTGRMVASLLEFSGTGTGLLLVSSGPRRNLAHGLVPQATWQIHGGDTATSEKKRVRLLQRVGM